MLKFSTYRGSSDNAAKAPGEDLPQEVQGLLNEFVEKLTQYPSCTMLRGFELKIEADIRTILLKDIEEAKLGSPRLTMDAVLEDFKNGKYDDLVFGQSPRKTEALETLINGANREFMQRLFLKCSSVEQLTFWLAEGAKMPKDALALAVLLGNNVYILRYLKEQGALENLPDGDKQQLLMRANRFDNQGLEFLKQALGVSSPRQQVSKP